jgi:hypothetical protein
MAVKRLVLLFLFLNYTALPLLKGGGPVCGCRLPGSMIPCCSFNLSKAENPPSGTLVCYCRELSGKKVEYRQGCRCGLDKESDKRPLPLLVVLLTETGSTPGGYIFESDPGKALPGFESPPVKPPPASRFTPYPTI